MRRHTVLLLAGLLAYAVHNVSAQTPVIGGSCKIGTADVQIGGKQTQFFLKCEATSESSSGEGVWVVKSRSAAASPTAPVPPTTAMPVPQENIQPQQRPPLNFNKYNPNICEQDNNARETDSCSVSATCLQSNADFPTTFLQCEQSSMRWVKKSCQEGFIFNFEQQACIVPKRPASAVSLCASHMECTNNGCPSPMLCSRMTGCCRVMAAPSLLTNSSSKHLILLRDSTTTQLDKLHQKATPVSTVEAKSAVECEDSKVFCQSDNDCPRGFRCDGESCYLETCPDGTPARIRCHHQYHCSARDHCIYGACCPLGRNETQAVDATTHADPYAIVIKTMKTRKMDATTANIYDAALASGDDTAYSSGTHHSSVPFMESIDSNEHLATSGAACERDGSFVGQCSLNRPCSEESECIDGLCCILMRSRCSNALMPLAFPESCRLSTECPVGSTCEDAKCCPSHSRSDLTADHRNGIATSLVTDSLSVDSIPTIFSKFRCLRSPRCNATSLCPPQFTCSLEGKCCRIFSHCPDETVPESLCAPERPCPSSEHSCDRLNHDELFACCPSGQQSSLGLVCTYSSCSNSNPCSVGTCNNGYCCSSGGNTNTQIIHTCAGGFQSPIACGSAGLEPCPLGLHCDQLLHVCCPLLLPLVDGRNPDRHLEVKGQPSNSHPEEFHVEPESGPIRRSHIARKPIAAPSSSSCNGCQQAPQIITIPSCTSGCPRGYSGCCGTSRSSCCLRKQCPQGTRPTGTHCNSDCPQHGQLCVSGICCSPTTSSSSSPSCPNGGQSYGSCASSGFCATGYLCIQGSCCPSYNQQPQILLCPGGGQAVGSCVSGSCATGYSCSSNNQCCPTTNPFVCSDGTQAAGGCVNGLCGSGYTCSNGLCCASTSSQPKCLDGSPAVGACIPSCTGDQCGRRTLTYYCGSGYTCTTGNICCPTTSCPDGGEPIGPTVNGLCPTGYSAQGTQCCSIVATCLTGETNIGEPINNLCPTGSTLRGNACCQSASTALFAATCTAAVQLGPCINQVAGDACGGQLGYACRADADGITTGELACCPMVNYLDSTAIIGPALDGNCPVDYTPVRIVGQVPELQCVALSSIPGLCAAADQAGPCIAGDCPTGYTCNVYADVCCPTTTAMSRLRNSGPSSPPRSIFSSRPQPSIASPLGTCPNGDEPASGCMNGLCGAGLECRNGLCCPAGLNPAFPGDQSSFSSYSSSTERQKRMCPNGEEALSSCFADGTCGDDLVCLGGVCCGTPTVHNSYSQARSLQNNQAIGSSCTASQQCAGFSDGLSKCERRVCRCTSIAYAKGIACVRKKMLMFNDEPVPVESGADTNSVLAPSS